MSGMTPEKLAQLRAPFPPEAIGKKPQVTCSACSRNKTQKHCENHKRQECRVCGNYLTTAHMHLDFVGHAEATGRLLDVDPEWTWEPMAYTEAGLPAVDQHGGLWIRMTVCGVTKPGYGDAQGKEGPNAVKETIGDAIRNAGMRFGMALELWGAHRGQDHPAQPRRVERPTAPHDGQAAETPAPRNVEPARPPRTPEQRAADAVKVILASPTADAVETARKRVLKAPPEVQTVDVSGLVPEAQRDVLGVRPGEAVTLSELADLRLDVLATAADAKAAS